MYYLNIFLFYSVLGYLLETISMFVTKNPYNSGILFGPYATIYGFAGLIIIFLDKFLKKKKLKKWLEILSFFILSLISLTILEFSSGVFIYWAFKIVYWDYINLFAHLWHFSALLYSFIWAFLATVSNYLLNPFLKKILKKIPNYLTIFLLIIMIIDLIYTFIGFYTT